MSHKKEMLEMLARAGEMLSEQMPTVQVMQSNLLTAWLQQVASALAAVGLEDELEVWEEARKVQVKVDSETGLRIYAMSMRAILLGLLHKVESTPD